MGKTVIDKATEFIITMMWDIENLKLRAPEGKDEQQPTKNEWAKAVLQFLQSQQTSSSPDSTKTKWGVLAKRYHIHHFIKYLNRKPLDAEEKRTLPEPTTAREFFISLLAYTYGVQNTLSQDDKLPFYRTVATELYFFAYPLVVMYGTWQNAFKETAHSTLPIQDMIDIANTAIFLEKQLYIMKHPLASETRYFSRVMLAKKSAALLEKNYSEIRPHCMYLTHANTKEAEKYIENIISRLIKSHSNLYDVIAETIAYMHYVDRISPHNRTHFHYLFAAALTKQTVGLIEKYKTTGKIEHFNTWNGLLILNPQQVEREYKIEVWSDRAKTTTYFVAFAMLLSRSMGVKHEGTRQQLELLSYLATAGLLTIQHKRSILNQFSLWKKAYQQKAAKMVSEPSVGLMM